MRGLLILTIAILAGVAGFLAVKSQRTNVISSNQHDGNSRLPELAWLRTELKLSDEQFRKVAKIHEAYRPTCEALCMKVMASHAKIKHLASPHTPVTPELEEALKEHALLHVECQKAMLNHLHNTASVMNPDQAETYLAALLPGVIELPLEPGGGTHSH